MLIVDELLLLAFDDSTGKSRASGTNLDAGLGAALLVELALTERISVAPVDAGWREKGKVTVINTTPTDDPDLDLVLAKLTEKEGQKVKNVINPMGWKPITHKLRVRRLERLVAQRVLAEDASGFWGIKRYPTLDGGPEREVRARLHAALVDGLTPSERTVALIALLEAVGILTKVVPTEDKKTLKQRAKRLAEGDWAAKAVKDALAEMMAVLSVATSTGANGGSN